MLTKLKVERNGTPTPRHEEEPPNLKQSLKSLLGFLEILYFSGKMVSELINANPIVYEKKERRARSVPTAVEEYAVEPIDQQEVFDHVRDIKDPEHPYSLEELKVITEDAIEVDDQQSYVRITFTPTVEHCSMATIIGLCLRVKLLRSLPSRYKVDIRVAPGSHASESAVNKQLNDKERVAAALENPNLVDMVDECLAPSYN
ncbi:protein AE7 isoform X2 [Castanea sativa]|uniref:protein AE7 isoform X2 n=1 Tax=Castanea sativa TaxID=21020 RepID=UPI003F650C39